MRTHEERHFLGVDYLGCPDCIADGVTLCYRCLRPCSSRVHTRCIPPGRWAVFAVYALVVAAVLVLVVGLAARYRLFFLCLGTLLLLLVLAWPSLRLGRRAWALWLR